MHTESTLSQPMLSSPKFATERRHARTAVEAGVPLHLNRRVFVRAELVDLSPTGFRVRHNSSGVKPGMIVHAWGFVSARVVWTRKVDDSRESGFELV